MGQRYGLPLLSPVDDAGVFTEEAGPFAGLAVQGDGNEAVVKVSRHLLLRLLLLLQSCFSPLLMTRRGRRTAVTDPQRGFFLIGLALWCIPCLADLWHDSAAPQALAAAGVLLLEERYAHKYPYDWRTKKPTIFRATDQVGS